MEKECHAESTAPKKSVFPYVGLFLIIWIIYEIIGTVMYTAKLVDFYNFDWLRSDFSIAINGKTSFGSMISVTKDLKALEPSEKGNTASELCPGITSERGFITMSVVGNTLVCCSTGNEKQWLVPFKDTDGFRHYLCGKWPNLDEVKRPLESVNVQWK